MVRLGERVSPRIRYALLDVAIVAVIVVHVAAFFVLRERQQRFDAEAREVATWMAELDLERVAWPAAHREAVPALLDAGVTPVLVDPDVAPQDLAVNDTGAIVVSGPPSGRLTATLSDERDLGSLTAYRVDLERAASTPLAPGETVGEEIARPYVYAPLRDSEVIPTGEPFRTTLRLAPGRYTFSAELFDPTHRSSARLSARIRARVLTGETVRLRLVVYEPTTLEFVVPGDRPQPLTLVVARRGDGGRGTALMHAWQVERQDSTR